MLTCVGCLGMEHGVGVGDKLKLSVQSRQQRTGQRHVTLTFSLNVNLVYRGGDIKCPKGCLQIHLRRGGIWQFSRDFNASTFTIRWLKNYCMVDAVFFFKTQTWREAGAKTGDCMRHCIFRGMFFLKYYIGYYGVTRNEDGFERPHLNALGGILQRTVGLSDNELICRTVNPTQNNKTFICICSPHSIWLVSFISSSLHWLQWNVSVISAIILNNFQFLSFLKKKKGLIGLFWNRFLYLFHERSCDGSGCTVVCDNSCDMTRWNTDICWALQISVLSQWNDDQWWFF